MEDPRRWAQVEPKGHGAGATNQHARGRTKQEVNFHQTLLEGILIRHMNDSRLPVAIHGYAGLHGAS
jgi:hypothetical protein